jgi:hypothetical protein
MLVLHIAGAGVWLGANVMQLVVPGMAARQSTEAVVGWYRVASSLSKKLYTPVAIVVLTTGVVMVLLDDSFSFGSLFVTIGFGMVVIGALFGMFIFDPTSEAAASAVETGDLGKVRAASSRIATFGTIDTLLLLFTMTAMVLRWM